MKYLNLKSNVVVSGFHYVEQSADELVKFINGNEGSAQISNHDLVAYYSEDGTNYIGRTDFVYVIEQDKSKFIRRIPEYQFIVEFKGYTEPALPVK